MLRERSLLFQARGPKIPTRACRVSGQSPRQKKKMGPDLGFAKNFIPLGPETPRIFYKFSTSFQQFSSFLLYGYISLVRPFYVT